MKTFNMSFKDGGEPVAVTYTPIQVQVGDVVHHLALHRIHAGWQVSDPKSGARVCSLNGLYKGIRVSSKGYTQREAKALAGDQVLACAERIGLDRFNQVLKTGKTRAG